MKKTALIFVLLLAVLSYALLFGRYRPAQIDDAYTASYVWNLTHMGVYEDLVMGDEVSNVQYFGHVHARIAAFLADALGWTHAVFHGFNLLCLLLAAPAWLLIGRRLLGSWPPAAWAVLFLYLTEAFIGCAYTARSDALVFGALSWGVFCAAAGFWFPAALLVSLAVEIHAIGAVGYFYIAAFLFAAFMKEENHSLKWLRGAALRAALGLALGFAFYRLAHPEPLGDIFNYLLFSNKGFGESFNALTAHYFHRAYLRFLPELAFLVAGAVLYFRGARGRALQRDPLTLLFFMALLASVLIRRGNFKYVVFFYPPLFFLAVAGYRRAGLLKAAGALFAVYCLTLSLALAWQNRLIDRPAFNRDMLAALPRDGRAIIGPSNAWFPLRERLFYENCEAWLKSRPPDGLVYFIESPYGLKPYGSMEALPPCARLLEPAGPPVAFNGGEMRIFSADLGACLKNE